MIDIFTKSNYPPAESKIPLYSLAAALRSGGQDFRQRLRGFLGVEHCVLGSSTRALLSTLLARLGERHRERDEVLIPGYTCYSVAAAAARAGLKVGVYDLDPVTFRPDMDTLKGRMSGRTLAVLTQHLFGIPTPMGEVMAAAREHGIPVIDDAAQAFGGVAGGSPVGTQGDYGLYSFGRGKPLPLGGGGALIGRDAPLMGTIHMGQKRWDWAGFVQAAMLQALSHPRVYGLMEALPLGLGETVFDPGFTVGGMGVSLQRIGSSALGSLHRLNAHRRAVSQVYRERMRNGLDERVMEGGAPVFPRFPVLAGAGEIPPGLKALGVRRMYPKAIADVPVIMPHLAGRDLETPGARAIARTLITLPTHVRISTDLAAEIARQVNTEYGSART